MSIKQIQGTNDYSTASKFSMVQNGYFKDKYIHIFVNRYTRRAPLVNVGYYVRAVVINFTLQSFLKTVSSEPAQIVSCGAGFDSNYFRLASSETLHHGIVYYELDFLGVVYKKRALIQESAALVELVGETTTLSDGVSIVGQQYRLLAVDLGQLDRMEEILVQAGINFSLPTLFLSECAITYMEEASSTDLIKWAAHQFKDSSFATYEQIFPNDGFGTVMRNHFDSINTPLHSLKFYPDLLSQEERYKAHGWVSSRAEKAWDVFKYATNSKERLQAVTLEPLDEWEEWHLKCCHYVLTVAAKGTLIDWFLGYMDTQRNHPIDTRKQVQISITEDIVGVCRFSHQVVTLGRNNLSLAIGGFGPATKGNHSRLDRVDLLRSGCVIGEARINFHDNIGAELNVVHHTCTLTSEVDGIANIVLYGGRSSPNKGANTLPALLRVDYSDHNNVRVSVSRYPSCNMGDQVMDAKWRHTAIFLPHLNVITIFGGRTVHFKVLDELWLLGPSSLTLCERKDPWPSPRCSHSAVLLENGGMLVTGGLGCVTESPHADAWLLNPDTLTWRNLALAMLPRYSHTSACLGGKVVLVGGVNLSSGLQPGVCVIDMLQATCVEYALPSADPRRPLLLYNHCMIHGDDGCLYIIGGGGNCFSFGTRFNEVCYWLPAEQLLG